MSAYQNQNRLTVCAFGRKNGIEQPSYNYQVPDNYHSPNKQKYEHMELTPNEIIRSKPSTKVVRHYFYDLVEKLSSEYTDDL